MYPSWEETMGEHSNVAMSAGLIARTFCMEFSPLLWFAKSICFPGKILLKGKKPNTLYLWLHEHHTTSWPNHKIFELELLLWYEERLFVIPMSVGFTSCETIPPITVHLFRPPESFLSTLQGYWLQHFYILNLYIYARMKRIKNMRDMKSNTFFSYSLLQVFHLKAKEQPEANAASSGIWSCCTCIGFTVKS